MINARANTELRNLVIIAVPAAAVGYLALRGFGFDFILGRGPLLIAGGLFILAVRMKSWWPAALLLAQAPFQAVVIQNFGLVGNLISLAAATAFLSTRSPESLPRVLLGNTTLRLAALFFFGFSFSMFLADRDFVTWLSMFQKINLLIILAAVAHGFRVRNVVTLASIAVGSTALMFAMGLIELYFGADALPFLGSRSVGVFELAAQNPGLSDLSARLDGIGNSMGPNRLAFTAILPIALAFGLILVRQNGSRGRHYLMPLSFAGLLVIGIGVMLSGSRSGALGVAVVIGVLLLYLSHGRHQIRIGVVAAVLVIIIWWVMPQILPTSVTAYDRLTNKDPTTGSYSAGFGPRVDKGRLEVWRAGIEVFLEQPISGVGLRRFQDAVSTKVRPELVRGPHSGFIQTLAETGLLGTIPFLLLLGYVLRVLTRQETILTRNLRVWRVVFLAAFLGMMSVSVFNTYQFERFFWIPIAFAAMLESSIAGSRSQPKY